MQIPQTTYNEFPAAAQNGMISKNGPSKKLSRFASGAITVGTFVLGTADDVVEAIPDATASLARVPGVAALDTARSPYSTAIATDSGSGQYSDGDDVKVLHSGCIHMWCEGTATEGNDVYVRCTAASTSVNGQVKDGAATNFVKHPTAKFAASRTGAGIVLVEVK